MTDGWPATGTTWTVPARGGWVREWPRWAPRAAVGWSLVYAALGAYWSLGGHGFPHAPEPVAGAVGSIGPLIERFRPSVAWTVVGMAGLPAAAMGAAMWRGVRRGALRPLLLTAGGLLAGVLLLLMTGLNLLVLFGYVPYVVFDLLTRARIGGGYLKELTQWPVVHQVLCLVGGFLWLAATVAYGRRSGDACLRCGRRDGPRPWQAPNRAARWGRIAVYVSMVAPAFYAFTRFAWALGFPLGMSAEQLRRGQERGLWVSGLFLATFGLAGAALTLGLVQRWGEVFPRWMIGLAGRRVPVALAVIPASFVSVLLVVGGVVIWSQLGPMAARLAAGGARGMEVVLGIAFPIGPTLLFPVWGVAVAVATLGYCYRRRGACAACGRGAYFTAGAEPGSV